MKYPIAFSLVTSLLVTACAGAPSHGGYRTASLGSTRPDPGGRGPKPPADILLGGRDFTRDLEPYRPRIVLIPKEKAPKAYQEYVEREFRRDPNGGYQGVRRNKPWGW